MGIHSLYKQEQHLNRREKQVLQLCAQGKTNKEIAPLLGINNNVVSMHLSNACEKLQPNEGGWTKQQCIEYAIAQGIINLEASDNER